MKNGCQSGGFLWLEVHVAVAPSAVVVVIPTPPAPLQTMVVMSGTVAGITVLASLAALAVVAVAAGFAVVVVVVIFAGLAVVGAARAPSAVLTAAAAVGTAVIAATPTGCQTAGVGAASAVVGNIIISCIGGRGEEILDILTAVVAFVTRCLTEESVVGICTTPLRMLHSLFYPSVCLRRVSSE